jgi:hypothetical protein
MWRARAFGHLVGCGTVTALGGAREVNWAFSVSGMERGFLIEARDRLRSKHTVVCGYFRCRASAALQSHIMPFRGRQPASMHVRGEGLARFTVQQ